MVRSEDLRGKRVLHFEDEPEKNQEVHRFLMRKHGMNVETAEDPATAYAAIGASVFDIIILDIRIENSVEDGVDPTRFGLHFLRQLRNGMLGKTTKRTVPVLAISCVVESSTLDELREIGESNGGRYRYLTKPVEELAMIERALLELLDET